MSTATAVISVFEARDRAGKAVKSALSAGMDMNTLSIVGKANHSDFQAAGFYTSGDRIKVWGGNGAFWGGVWGMLYGAAFFWIPGFGPLLVAGPFFNTVLGSLEGVALVGGSGALESALVSLGMQKQSAIGYETDLKQDRFLLIANGAPAQVDLVRVFLEQYNAPGTSAYGED